MPGEELTEGWQVICLLCSVEAAYLSVAEYTLS